MKLSEYEFPVISFGSDNTCRFSIKAWEIFKDHPAITLTATPTKLIFSTDPAKPGPRSVVSQRHSGRHVEYACRSYLFSDLHLNNKRYRLFPRSDGAYYIIRYAPLED